jgi:Zn-dependent protease with chaperone function
MEVDDFKRLVTRLERESAVAPRAYRTRVAALAVLGFGILALLLGAMGLGIVALVGVALAIALSGGKAAILLLKLGKLAVLLVVPAWYLMKATVKALFVRVPAPQGREIVRAQAPALFAAIDDMRRRMKGPRFHHVLIDDDVNAGVMQRPAFGLFGWPRNYLVLGLPLLEALPADEALSVVAHEYGHLAGSHGRFSAFIYRLRHTWGTVQAHIDSVEGWIGKLVAPMIRWYAPYFNAYTFVLARADEYQADAAAAELVGAHHAAHALMRVNIVGPRHQRFMSQTYDRIAHDAVPPADVMQRWADEAGCAPVEADAAGWLREALDREGHFTDTHPTLRARLDALRHAASGELVPPPPLAGPSAAQAWLGPLAPALRQAFQHDWANRVEETWKARHEQALQQRARLSELRALPAPEAAQVLEMLHLARRVEPDVDQREPLAAFNAAHPDHAEGLFLEGCERLEREDASGLPLLEAAMKLDPDAIKPACQRAHAFLLERGDKTGAEACAQRWRDRDAHETLRDSQVRTISTAHALAPHGLDAEVLAQVRALLTPTATRHVEAIHLARRVIPADPSIILLVMGVRLTWWGRRRKLQGTVVQRIAAGAFPVAMTVISLDGAYKAFEPKFKALEGARLK